MSDLTPEKLAELRRLAEACPMPDNDPDTLSEWYEIEDLTERNYPIPPIDAAFIVAASPDVVLGLLDRLVHMTEARDNARAEVERLTARMESVEAGRETEQTMIRNAVAQLVTVREWIDRRGVDVSDRDGAYWDGYRAAQRHALQDAAELRAALDGEADRG